METRGWIAKYGYLAATVAVGGLLIAFTAWCVHLVADVERLRGDVETRVSWLRALEDGVPPAQRTAALQAMAEVDDLGPSVEAVNAATEDLGETLALKQAVRRQTSAISRELGSRWGSMYTLAFIAIFLGATQLALLILMRRVYLSRARLREKLLAERLTEADRLAVVGTLTASIAHEVNNPLASAQGSLEFARKAIANRNVDELGSAIDDALEATLRTVGIIRDLRGLARRDGADAIADTIDISSSVDSAINLASTALREGIEVRVTYADNLQPVRGRDARLRQLFLNIILNAGQALGAEAVVGGRIDIRVDVEGAFVVVRIDDDGPGMSAELRARAFEPYVTTKGTDGTGLGLFLCKRIVESVGGTVAIPEPPDGVGTRVEVRLPIARPAPMDRSRPPPDALRILIIDDEPGLGRAIARLVRPHEAQVEEDPHEALERLRTETFDVVLCEVNMPNSSGIELFEALPEYQSRFILMSGAEFGEAGERLDVVCIHKPFTQAQLLKAIELVHVGPSRLMREA